MTVLLTGPNAAAAARDPLHATHALHAGHALHALHAVGNVVVQDCAELIYEHDGLLVIECMGADTERRRQPRRMPMTVVTGAALDA